MPPLSILAMMMTLAVPGATASPVPVREGRTIMTFGARWCAPCMVEYRELPELVRAAAPDQITLAWVDRQIAAPPGAVATVRSLSTDEARRAARRIGGEGYGLPFSAMFDETGHLCAVWRARLKAADVAVMRAQCDQAMARGNGGDE